MTQKRKPGQHMGVRDLADILKLITIEPMTAMQASSRHCLRVTHMRRTLKYFVQGGIAHVCGWDCSKKGTPAAIFKAGPGVNVPQPLPRTGQPSKTGWGRGQRIRPTVGAVAFCSIVKVLEEGATCAELVEQTGCHEGTVRPLLRHMKRAGLIHVCAWDAPSSGYPAQVFAMGQRRDALRPKRMTEKERSLKYYHERKARERQLTVMSALAGVPA